MFFEQKNENILQKFEYQYIKLLLLFKYKGDLE